MYNIKKIRTSLKFNAMSNFVLSTLLLFLSLNLFSQDISVLRYKTDLQDAETIQDTIATLLTYTATSSLGPKGSIKLMKETIGQKYPVWFELERDLLLKDPALDIVRFENFVKNSKSTALRKYALMQLRVKEIKEGKSDKVNYETLSGDFNDPEIRVFNNYLKATQFRFLNQSDSIFSCIKYGVDGIDESIYTGLQLEIIAATLATQFPKITKEASTYIEKGIRLSESLNEFKLRSRIYNAEMAYYKYRGETKEAMQAALNYIEMNKKTGDIESTVIGYINLAAFHQEQGRFDDAYEIIFKARNLAQTNNDNTSTALTYSSEGNAKMTERKYSEAIRLFQLSEKIDPAKTIQNKTMAYVNIIDCYYMTYKLDSAYIFYKKLEEIDPKNKTGNLSYAKTFVSKYLVDKGDYKLAQEYINEAMADALAYEDISSKSTILRAQSDLYKALGNHKDALVAYKEHMDIEVGFRNADLASATTKIQLESDFKNEKKIIALKNENEKMAIKSQRDQALFLGGFALFLALATLGFYLFVRRKNTKINTQNQKLEELNNVKDTLFQIIGHDLKKPTINFRNVSKNINYLIEKEDFKRLKMLGEEVDQDAKSLYNLTDNLLNWALMQKDTISIKPERVNVHEIVNYNLDLFAALSKRKDITLENHVGKDIYSLVDRNSLDTIVRNLIDNAIKYTPEGGLISLSSKIADGIVRLSVSDTGLGMDQNKIDAINNEQTIKSKKGTEGEKGSGLGLQLVKQLLKKNNGTIEIQSDGNMGSTFVLALPMAS